MATQKTYKVTVLPATGQGNSYKTTVTAINVPMAKQIMQAQLPSNWKSCGYNELRGVR